MGVRKEIMEFISRKEKNGALLLTGKWGCGKTYLIRQVRDELNNLSMQQQGKQVPCCCVFYIGIAGLLYLHRAWCYGII